MVEEIDAAARIAAAERVEKNCPSVRAALDLDVGRVEIFVTLRAENNPQTFCEMDQYRNIGISKVVRIHSQHGIAPANIGWQ